MTYRSSDGKTYSALQVRSALKFGDWSWKATDGKPGSYEVVVKDTGENLTLVREDGYWLAHCSAAGEPGERVFRTEAEADAYQAKHRETCPYSFGHVIEAPPDPGAIEAALDRVAEEGRSTEK